MHADESSCLTSSRLLWASICVSGAASTIWDVFAFRRACASVCHVQSEQILAWQSETIDVVCNRVVFAGFGDLCVSAVKMWDVCVFQSISTRLLIC